MAPACRTPHQPARIESVAYLDVLDTALSRIRAFGAGALVLAPGLGAHEGDPF
jgi:hypothetical protein